MKKLFLALTACFFAACLSVPVFAAEADSRVVDVYAKYVSNITWNTASPNGDGEATITLPDKTEVKVSKIKNGKWTLVVEEITEKEALDYIYETAGTDVESRLPLNIFFLDEKGGVHSADGTEISITPQKKLAHPAAYALTGDSFEALNVSSGGGSIKFKATDSKIYLVGSLKQSTPMTPETGDAFNTALWLSLMLLSVAAITGVVVCEKRKRTKV